jgi:hypothetical protein
MSAKPTLTKQDSAILTTRAVPIFSSTHVFYAKNAVMEWLQVGGLLCELTRIFVSLKHKLGDARVGIPELHSTIFRTAEHPLAVWGKSDTKNKVLRNALELVLRS